MLSVGQHAAVADAIRAAESRSSGEIFCVVARRSDGYFYPAALVVALATLVASLPAAVVLDRLWGAPPATLLVVAQLLSLALAGALLAARPGLRLRMVPRAVKLRRAQDNARRQFLARNIHRTTGRNGVLIFVSLAERYAEIIADAALDARVDTAVWQDAVEALTAAAADDRLTDGLCAAVDRVGAVLAEHFPAAGRAVNATPDHVAEI